MQSFDELSDFLCRWYDCAPKDLSYAGDLPEQLQADVAEFYRRFGALSIAGSPFDVHELPLPFGAQDLIEAANELKVNEDGSIFLISENQGVWVAGQMPDSDNLWASVDAKTWDYTSDLQDMQKSLKSALITHALYETLMSSTDTGTAFSLDEWDAAERDILTNGTVLELDYLTVGYGALVIGMNDDYLACRWKSEEGFMWMSRRGDRAKGWRPGPFSIGRPVAQPPQKKGALYRLKRLIGSKT